MSQYVITIVRVGDDEFAGPVSQTVVRIDAQRGHTLIKELTIRSPEGTGLGESDVPYVDFPLLLEAFRRPTWTSGPAPVPAPPDPAPPPHPPSRVASGARRATARHAAEKAAPATTKGGGAAPAVAGRTPATKATRLRTGRAYRRAPSADELEAAYEETGTITGVAAHFDVPVHTAQGWISRLRRNNVELAGG